MFRYLRIDLFNHVCAILLHLLKYVHMSFISFSINSVSYVPTLSTEKSYELLYAPTKYYITAGFRSSFSPVSPGDTYIAIRV